MRSTVSFRRTLSEKKFIDKYKSHVGFNKMCPQMNRWQGNGNVDTPLKIIS